VEWMAPVSDGDLRFPEFPSEVPQSARCFASRFCWYQAVAPVEGSHPRSAV
jgi:hypothetical protein